MDTTTDDAESEDGDAGAVSGEADNDAGTCDVELARGGPCGRELPCPYHD